MTNLKTVLEYILFQMFNLWFIFLPRKAALSGGRLFGSLFYAFDRKHRRIALSNLETAFGSTRSISEQKRIARKAFCHFGKVIFDIIKISHLKKKKKLELVSLEGAEYLQSALKEGKGALLFSGHYGNWEVAPLLLSQFGPLNVIARPLDNRLLEKKLMKLRRGLGARVIYKQQSTRQVIRALRANEMVAVLIDQNVLRSQAIFVEFFGKEAATTPSLATFFLRTKAPLIPVFCTFTSDNTYRIKVLKPLSYAPGKDSSQDVLKITQVSTKIIENQIRADPDCWLWFHNRWKTRPEIKAEK